MNKYDHEQEIAFWRAFCKVFKIPSDGLETLAENRRYK